MILSTASRLPVGQSLALVRSLSLPASDNDDPFIPLMLWFVLESHCADHPEQVTALFDADEFWSRPVVAGY